MLIFNCLLILIQQARNPRSYASQNYDPLTDSLTGVKCRATSVAKSSKWKIFIANIPHLIFTIVAVDKKTNVCLVNYLMNFYPRNVFPPDIHGCCTWQEDECFFLVNYLMNFYPRNVFPRKTHLIFMIVALDKKLNVYLMKEVAQCCWNPAQTKALTSF